MEVSDGLPLDRRVSDHIVTRGENRHLDVDTQRCQMGRNGRSPFLHVNEYRHLTVHDPTVPERT
jgi:hypothetical protein